MRFRCLFVALMLMTAGVVCAADFDLRKLQGNWKVTDFESGEKRGVVRIQEGKIAALGKMVDAQPLVGSEGESKVETLSGGRVLVLCFDSRFGKSEAGFVFKVDSVSDGLLLRSGGAKWLLTHLSAKELDALFDSKETVFDPGPPRPRVPLVKTQQVRPEILAEGLAGTTNIGPMTADPKWKNYDPYLHRMIESVQVQWERLLGESKVYPKSGSTVTVKFILDSKGLIAKIVNVDSTANDAASHACMSAITDRAPYGDWTDEMKAVLGEQQEMTFTFYYQ